MHNGYIKVHRKLFNSYLSSSPFRLALWVHLLAMANHKDNEFIFNGEKTLVKRGQLITGRKALAKRTGISESYVTKLLKEFEKYGMLCQQTTNLNRLISITKYTSYQSEEHPRNIQGTSKEHPRDTNNNVKNVKNVNKRFISPLLTDVEQYCKERKSPIKPSTFFDYFEASGWIKANNQPVRDWKATLRTWENRLEPTQKRTTNEL